MEQGFRLRYVDAGEIGSEVVDFDDLKVRTPAGDKLGEVEGFIIDSDQRRAYYIVVDSGGWFSSRRFLVPIGHARIDDDADALVVDVDRDTISRYPEFDPDSFSRLSEDEMRQYQQRYGQACCPDDAVAMGGDWNYESYRHYRQPDWWRTEYYNWDAPAAVGTSGTVAAVARDESLDRRDERDERLAGDEARRRGAEGGDVSPHLGGRAQPGDVLGLESGGETTALGDTDEDENKRRRDAERDAGESIKRDVPDRSGN